MKPDWTRYEFYTTHYFSGVAQIEEWKRLVLTQMCNRHAIRANVNKRSEVNVCHANVLYKVRGMWERKLCLHTALNRTFTIPKVNLNLQYFCLIEIWKSEVQG